VNRMLMTAAVAVCAVALVGACSSSSGTRSSTPEVVPSVWPLPADVSAAAQKAGLTMLDREMLAVHYHAHLDVIVRGVRVQVPAGIGIDVAKHLISPLHTHDTTGIVHIESAVEIPFTLGQFFTEWGQPLTSTRVGPVVATDGEQVRVYRNGTVVSSDPETLRFSAHAEIVVWLGPASEKSQVPAAYEFPTGL